MIAKSALPPVSSYIDVFLISGGILSLWRAEWFWRTLIWFTG